MELIKDEYIIALKEWLEYAISSGQEKVSIELNNNKLTFRCIPGEFVANGNRIIEKTHQITINDINDDCKNGKFIIRIDIPSEINNYKLAKQSLESIHDMANKKHKLI